MSERLSRGSLLPKIAGLILATMYLPLLLVIWFLGAWLSGTQLQQAETMLEASLSQSVVNMNMELQFIEQLAYSYTSDYRLALYLHNAYDEPVDIAMQLEAHEYLQERLWLSAPTRLSLRRVVLFSDNQGLWMSGRYLFPYSWLSKQASERIYGNSNREWWSTPSTPLVIDDGLVPSLISELRESVFFNHAVIWPDSSSRAVLSMQVPLSIFVQYLSNISGTGWLITQEGEILASSGAWNFDGNRDDILARVLAEENRFIYEQRNNDVFVHAFTLSNGWMLVHAQPYAALQRDTTFARITALGIALLMGVLFLGLLAIFWRIIIRRTRHLLEKMELIQGGNFSGASAMASMPIRSPDELSALDMKLTAVAHQLDTLVRENYELIVQRKDLALRALQAQINPHFLYNTLSTIKWMTLKHSDEEIREVVDAMSSFYRISLSNGEEIISLSEELRCTQAYLSILRFRMMGHIQVHFDVDESLLNLRIPKLVLQPLVENSIVHGPVEQQPMTLIVRACRRDTGAEFSIIDDGRGTESQKAKSLLSSMNIDSEGGYGLHNVSERLRLFYGDSVAMEVVSAPGQGMKVSIYIPEIAGYMEEQSITKG